MKLRLITAAALVAAGSAQALSPAQIESARAAGTLREIYIAGASAQRLFIAAWFKDQCNPANYDVFFNGTGTAPSGSSYRAYSCNLRRAVGQYPTGTPFLLVKRDTGGSIEGVNPIAKPLATQTAQTTMLVDSTCTATGNPSPATDILAPSYACNGTQSRISDGGVSDVEPALFQRPVNLQSPAVPLTTAEQNNLNVGIINQTIFGVAVNLKAYRALQETQGLPQNDNPLNQPSLPRTWVAGALRGDVRGDGGVATPLRKGWGAVISSTVDPTVGNKTVNVCRRNIGSGTQASFNAYFLNAGCVAAATNVNLVPGGQTIAGTSSTPVSGTVSLTGTNAFVLNSGSGTVETCLGTSVEGLAGGDAYGIGLLSRENTPTPTGAIPPVDKGYRFVKLDGIAPTRDNAKVGDYDFVYSATLQWNKTVLTDPAKVAFLTNLRTNAGRAASLNVADVDTQEGVMAPPASYTGAWASITDPVVAKFAARSERGSGQSCAAYRIIK